MIFWAHPMTREKKKNHRWRDERWLWQHCFWVFFGKKIEKEGKRKDLKKKIAWTVFKFVTEIGNF